MKKTQANSRRWIKITVHLRFDLPDYKQVVCNLVSHFESEFKVKHLYYARYTNLASNTVEISAFTGADWDGIKKFFKRTDGVLKVQIEDRGSGSLAHAYAYQAVKHIKIYKEDLAEDDAFLDVLHWFCNMRGLDYVREARAYTFAALRILHKTALESEQQFKVMRDFNLKARSRQVAEDLVTRLNLLGNKNLPRSTKWRQAKNPVRLKQIRLRGKDRAGVARPSDGLRPGPKQSARAVAGKAHGSSGSRSAGSGH